MDRDLGAGGAVVTRRFEGAGRRFAKGEKIPPAVLLDWPLNNRRALAATGKIRFLDRPTEPTGVAGPPTGAAERSDRSSSVPRKAGKRKSN